MLPDGWATIRGWFDTTEAEAYHRLAAGKVVLELGSYCGRSTVVAASVAERVVAVDWFRGCPEVGEELTFGEFLSNLDRFNVREKVDVCVSRHEEAGELLQAGTFDLVLIDGEHTAAAVERDTRLALVCLRRPGVICWHDHNYASVRDGLERAGLKADDVAGVLGWAHVRGDG